MDTDGNAEGSSTEDWKTLRLRVERLEREVAALRLGATVPGAGSSAAGAGMAGGAMAPSLEGASHGTPSIPPPPLPPRASLEDRLGSQVFNRVAIVALLIGTAYALKLAIDKGYLGPVARTLIGLAAGAGIILGSERFRRQGVQAFAYSLKAVGSGVLYLSLWAAFQLYHLLPSGVALGAMLLVTAWNAFMAWSQDAELLAAYALIGGFATPLLLSTGGDHKVFLFTYLLAIDAAAVVLIRVKGWPRLLLGTFPGTISYFIGWYVAWYRAAALGVTTLFVLLFWCVFVAASVGRLLARDEGAAERGGLEAYLRSIFLPLANAAFVGLALYSVLQDSGHHPALPWVMLGLAAGYLGIMRVPQSRTVAAMHLTAAVVFLTVAIPLKANGHWITVAWLVEGVALLWVAARAGGGVEAEGLRDGLRVGTVLRWLGCGALALGFLGVMTAPWWFGAISPATAFLNWRFGAGMVGAASFAAAVWLALGAKDERGNARPVWNSVAALSTVAFNLVMVWSVVEEIATFWQTSYADTEASLRKALAISAFLMAYGAALLAVGFWKRTAFVRWHGLVLLVFTIGKTFLWDIRSLSQGYRVMSFLGLGALLMGVSFAYQKDWLSLRGSDAKAEERR